MRKFEVDLLFAALKIGARHLPDGDDIVHGALLHMFPREIQNIVVERACQPFIPRHYDIGGAVIGTAVDIRVVDIRAVPHDILQCVPNRIEIRRAERLLLDCLAHLCYGDELHRLCDLVCILYALDSMLNFCYVSHSAPPPPVPLRRTHCPKNRRRPNS